MVLYGRFRGSALFLCYNIKMKESLEVITKNDSETRKLGESIASEILHAGSTKGQSLILSLEGDLGAGKTTFTQGFAKGLGIKDKIQSPTFIILKIYKIPKKNRFKKLIHVDAYRLKSKDFKAFGWKELVNDPENLILVEWGNKIKDILPKDSLVLSFGHIGHKNKRLIIKK